MFSILTFLQWALCLAPTNAFIKTVAPMTTATTIRNVNHYPSSIGFGSKTEALFQRRTLTATPRRVLHSSSSLQLASNYYGDWMPMPMWPYIGCSENCEGGPIGLFLALTLCGVGLPLSEDVLLIGLAARLGKMTLMSKIFHILAAVVGVATTDTLTVGIGRALRVNAGILGDQAPSFLRRMLLAVQRQLVVESKRDGARLKEQIQLRLRVATLNLGDQLRRLAVDFDTKRRTVIPNESPSPFDELWKRLDASSTWVRRITCNTRTSLAAWGQTSGSLTKIAASRLLRPPLENKKTSSNHDAYLIAGIDNRLALGQRWPLALLSGFSADFNQLEDYTHYFGGAALAAVTITLPVQLLLGAALQEWARILCYIVIAAAQLCRYGPIWAAVFVAIAETVQTEIEAAKKKNNRI